MPRSEIHPSVRAVSYFETASLAEAELTLAHAKEVLRRRQALEGTAVPRKKPGPKKRDADRTLASVSTNGE